METQIGIELCTSGSLEIITVNGICTIIPGILVIHSPVFPMLEIGRSEDYRSVMISEDIEKVMPVMSPILSSAKQSPFIIPYMQLNEDQQRLFIQRAEQIRDKEQELRDLTHPIQRNLMSSILVLAKQKALLECAFLFSNQLLQKEQNVSSKRRVFMSFLLKLNLEYHLHRNVNYFAQLQGLTPRHFSNIVKQESGLTPLEWISMVTISQAKNLLRKPDLPIKQIAAELGFPEQFTFRKYFKTHTGMSPRAYQQSVQ